jgi:DNA processing protein
VEERVFQLALTRVRSLGPVRQRKLIEQFGSAKQIFESTLSEISAVNGIGRLAASKIKSYKQFEGLRVELEEAKAKGLDIHFYTDDSYPNRLRFCADAPNLLYSIGNIDLNKERFVSIVGTRRATNYGKRMVKKLIEQLSEHRVNLVSGLAFGIDIYAHREALKYSIQNIAVVAHGLDRIYPNEHRQSVKSMLANGGLISEYPFGVKPDKEHFPERNRIIAGLTDATVVVESKKKGGAMITAEIADGYHRDVFAVPGKTEDALSQGCNFLIKKNRAHLLEDANDLLDIMNWRDQNETKKQGTQKKLFVSLTKKDEQILAFLKENGTSHTEEIARSLNTTTSKLALQMLELEMNGLVRSHPGSLYSFC